MHYVHPPHPLNLSDHLPISASFDFDLCPSTSSRDPVPRVNWSKGMAEGLLQLYEDALTLIVEPLLKINTQSCSELNDEIVFVCNAMVDCANELLPMSAPQKHTKTWVHNDQLRALCNDSKNAWREWNKQGRPTTGPLYDSMKETKKLVRTCVLKSRASYVRKQIKRRDQLFKSQDKNRFKAPTSANECIKLRSELSYDLKMVLLVMNLL